MSRRELYGVTIAFFGIAGVVFAAVTLPFAKLLVGLAIIAFFVVVWRRLEGAKLFDPIQVVAVVVLLVSVAVLLVDAFSDESKRSAPDPENEGPGKILRVYNKVTSGPERMREDIEPVSLSTKPVAFCGGRDVCIEETERETRGIYDAAVCQREGEAITNGQDTGGSDDDNPGLFTSTLYYGVRLDDTFGYVSEVWIDPKDRGGLGLPPCFKPKQG